MDKTAALFGDLTFVNLADVFQLLGGNNCTGKLHLSCKHAATPGLVYFLKGNPINATNGPLQGVEAIYPLFGWTEGNFEFHREKVEVKRVVVNNPMEIVMDALRMIDEGQIKSLGPTPQGGISAIQSGESKNVLPIIKRPVLENMNVIDHEKFQDGEMIVKEGGHGNWIWVILRGVVNINRETSKGSITIARLGEGCCIGNMASFRIYEQLGRSATVSAVGNVLLGVLDSQRLSEEFSSLSSDFQELLFSYDSRLRKISDKVVDLFVKKNKPKGLPKDKNEIIKEGSSKTEVFTITEGTVEIGRHIPNQNYLSLLTLKKGDVFGHIPFLDTGQEPRCASVLGSKDLKVNKLDPEGLKKEYDQLSGAFRSFIEGILTCISITTRLAFHLQMKKKR